MPVNSMTALAHNEFVVAGELMAASVFQGSPAPCSKEALCYIVDGIDSVSTEDWIPKVRNEKYRGAIEEVRTISLYVNVGDKRVSISFCLSYKDLFEICSGSALLIIF